MAFFLFRKTGSAVLCLFLAVCIFVAPLLMWRPILEGRFPAPRWLRTLMVLIHVPKDYKKDIVVVESFTSLTDQIFNSKFFSQFPGAYEGGLVLSTDSKNIEASNFNGKITCTFEVGAKQFSISNVPGSRNRFYFGGGSYGRPRDILFVFRVPDDVPLRTDFKRTAKVDSPDKNYEDKYGPLSFFIRKQVEY